MPLSQRSVTNTMRSPYTGRLEHTNSRTPDKALSGIRGSPPEHTNSRTSNTDKALSGVPSKGLPGTPEPPTPEPHVHFFQYTRFRGSRCRCFRSDVIRLQTTMTKEGGYLVVNNDEQLGGVRCQILLDILGRTEYECERY